MARILDSVANLAWPIIVAFCAIKIGPSLREIVGQREVRAKGGPGGVELEVGGQPVSAQRAVDDQRKETEALRAQLSLLASQVDVLTTEASESTDGEMDVRADAAASDGAGSLTYAEAAEDPQPSVRRILWVGDDPESSTYEIAALQDRGVEVVQSQSTRDAISKLANLASFDAVVTGMERFENGQLRPTAGLELINWIANSGPPVPVVVYASRHTARQYRSAVLEAGGLGATASATELFELLGVNFGPLSGSRLESEVLRIVKEGKAGEVSDLGHHGPVDVVMQRNGRRIGIEVKGWIQIPAPRAVKDVVSRLSNLVAKGEFDEVWLVTARPIDDPRPDTDEHREAVRVLSIEQLRDLVGVCSTGAALRSS